MILSARLPLSSLIELCRAARHSLGAGLTLVDVFRMQARKGPAAVRPVADRIRLKLEQGHNLEDTLKQEKASFPPLFVALVSVGEQSGNLPEVFGDLEQYFTLQLRLRRQFFSQISWPTIQLVLAILVISFMIWVLGIIAASRGGQPLDPLGIGLTGTGGAMTFLCSAFGFVGILIGGYVLATRTLEHKAVVDRFLLRLPVIGPCCQTLALARFCMALRLTHETAMPILAAMRLSLRATGNAAYEKEADRIQSALRTGESLTAALSQSDLFPEDFRNIMAVAEESGRVSEVMHQRAGYYQEEAERKLHILAQVAGWGVWLFVAILIIFAIFRIFFFYLSFLDTVA